MVSAVGERTAAASTRTTAAAARGEEGESMTPEERSMLWAISFYVVIDALPKVASLLARIAGMFQ